MIDMDRAFTNVKNIFSTFYNLNELTKTEEGREKLKAEPYSASYLYTLDAPYNATYRWNAEFQYDLITGTGFAIFQYVSNFDKEGIYIQHNGIFNIVSCASVNPEDAKIIFEDVAYDMNEITPEHVFQLSTLTDIPTFEEISGAIKIYNHIKSTSKKPSSYVLCLHTLHDVDFPVLDLR